jgi:hypothetical protein
LLTRRQPVALADRHIRRIEAFAELVPAERRAAYRQAVKEHLSGAPLDGAVDAACVHASRGYIDKMVLAKARISWNVTADGDLNLRKGDRKSHYRERKGS